MRRVLALTAVFLLVVAACGGDDDADTTVATTTAADTTTPADTTAPPATTVSPTTTDAAGGAAEGEAAIVIDAIDFANDRIVLRNAGGEAYDLTGHWICNRPNYAELPAETLEPGGTIELAASLVGLGPDGGELGVYTARAFDDPAAMVRYVAWGAAGQGRQGTAVEAGLWSEGDFVDNAGAGLVSAGDNPVGSDDWSIG